MRTKKQSFVSKTNFYFIEDFCKERDIHGRQLDFFSLTPFDRVLLSVYLTGLISKKFTEKDLMPKKIDQMLNIIFNFNGKKKRFRTDLKMFKDAQEMIAKFLVDKIDYCEYVNQEKIKTSTNTEDLFKIGINPTEFMIVDKMRFKKFEYILYAIYIIGTAKNCISCAHLNKFDLRIFSDSLRISKNTIDKLFKLMKWKYITVDKHYICWKSRWKLDIKSEDLSEEEQIEKKIAELIKDE